MPVDTMARMTDDSPLAVIWRRKVIVVLVFVIFVGATAVISKNLEKIYSTQSTLLVTLRADQQTFDSVQASQALARSFADVIDSPNIATRVAARLGDGTTPGQLNKVTSFEPVSETQLLKIHAEDKDPARAKRIADAYAQVFVEYAHTNLSRATSAEVSLADAAPLRRTPARPKPTLYTLLAAFFALPLGLGLAFLRDRLDRRVRTAEDVEASFEPPVLARVPKRGRSSTSAAAFSEAHRVLRTNLQFTAVEGEMRSIAVTSAQASEGKTTTVAELAVASAEVGLEVLAVEADFRRPGLQSALMPDSEDPLRPGLSSYLVGSASLDEVIHSTGRPNITIVPAGPLPPSPSALLDARRGRGIAVFEEHADLVLVDLPPLSIGADASVVATWGVTGVIVVIDLASAKFNLVRDALRQLEAVRATTLGLVLNRDTGIGAGGYEYYVQSAPPPKRKRGGVLERSGTD
jgi:succinoglycan biosynthesis transport protein ExoP